MLMFLWIVAKIHASDDDDDDVKRHPSYRPAVENQKIKCNEPMGYTPISYVIGKRNDAVKVGSGHVFA